MRQMLSLSIALALALVSGCSGSRAPMGSGSSSGTAGSAVTRSSTTSRPPSIQSAPRPPSTEVATVPIAARQHSEAGAEAFVRFYIDQLNLAWTSPRAGLLLPLSDPGCKSCKAFESTASRLVASGHHYAVPPVTVTTVTAYGGARNGRQLLRLLGRQTEAAVVDERGGVVSTDRAKAMKLDILLKWEGRSWAVLDMV